MLELMTEMHSYYIKSHVAGPKIHSKVFEDNSGVLEMARTPKLQPHTKHINNAYHHFHEYTQPSSNSAKPIIEIVSVSTAEQLGDMLTKPRPTLAFTKLHKKLLGW